MDVEIPSSANSPTDNGPTPMEETLDAVADCEDAMEVVETEMSETASTVNQSTLPLSPVPTTSPSPSNSTTNPHYSTSSLPATAYPSLPPQDSDESLSSDSEDSDIDLITETRENDVSPASRTIDTGSPKEPVESTKNGSKNLKRHRGNTFGLNKRQRLDELIAEDDSDDDSGPATRASSTSLLSGDVHQPISTRQIFKLRSCLRRGGTSSGSSSSAGPSGSGSGSLTAVATKSSAEEDEDEVRETISLRKQIFPDDSDSEEDESDGESSSEDEGQLVSTISLRRQIFPEDSDSEELESDDEIDSEEESEPEAESEIQRLEIEPKPVPVVQRPSVSSNNGGRPTDPRLRRLELQRREAPATSSSNVDEEDEYPKHTAAEKGKAREF
ncbi:hypothetical protein HK098_006109 [Nowakowskiella sp. JEL0407]|nr:hypothetical protein HK098_006109 [Nowakowskiella sp. JEL0407]